MAADPKVTPIRELPKKYVHSLLDVIENNPPDGSVLVYDADINKYVVKIITVEDLVFDGGGF